MKALLACYGVGFLIALSLLVGCTDPGDSTPPGTQIRQISIEELPALGEYLLPLDGERIEIANPADWYVPSRSSKFLARFQETSTSKYPTIILTGSDAEGISSVSASNVEQYAAEIATKESVPIAESVQLGGRCYVIYRKRGKEPQSINKIIERLFFTTVVAGRRYNIELRTREDSLEESEPYLHAVIAGIRYLKDEPAASPVELSEESPTEELSTEESPAEKSPSEDSTSEPDAKAPKEKPVDSDDPLEGRDDLF